MDVVLFFPDSCREAGDQLLMVLGLMFPGNEMLLLRNFQDLSRILWHLENKPRIAVLAAGSQQEFAELSPLRPFLRDTQIILMLPDGDVRTISQAHRWRPRLLTYLNGNSTSSETISVLKNILKS